jgi:hypothetical protein
MGLGTQGCMSETRTLLTINQLVHFKRGDEVIFFCASGLADPQGLLFYSVLLF